MAVRSRIVMGNMMRAGRSLDKLTGANRNWAAAGIAALGVGMLASSKKSYRRREGVGGTLKLGGAAVAGYMAYSTYHGNATGAMKGMLGMFGKAQTGGVASSGTSQAYHYAQPMHHSAQPSSGWASNVGTPQRTYGVSTGAQRAGAASRIGGSKGFPGMGRRRR